MIIKGVVAEDFLNYKEPSMFIAFPHCTFKCEKECGKKGMCQNSPLAYQEDIIVFAPDIVKLYLKNDITKAVVLGGLEPFDSFNDVKEFINCFRANTNDTIIIYTGYKEDEIAPYIKELEIFDNIIVKFGRFIPNNTPRFDEVLGITLASDNQYAKHIGANKNDKNQ